MISSMTGFSRFDRTEKGCTFVVEIRSLNNKFLDVHVRLPRRFNGLEDAVKTSVQKKLTRGRLTSPSP